MMNTNICEICVSWRQVFCLLNACFGGVVCKNIELVIFKHKFAYSVAKTFPSVYKNIDISNCQSPLWKVNSTFSVEISTYFQISHHQMPASQLGNARQNIFIILLSHSHDYSFRSILQNDKFTTHSSWALIMQVYKACNMMERGIVKSNKAFVLRSFQTNLLFNRFFSYLYFKLEKF